MGQGVHTNIAAIAACRPYLGMHYPSDVLAGALLGIGLGLIAPL